MLLAIFLIVFLQPQVPAQSWPGCNVTRVNDNTLAACSRDVPPDQPRRFTALSFSINQPTIFKGGIIANNCSLNNNASNWCGLFPYLVVINLSNRGIKIISNYSLFGLGHLRTIDLKNNKLKNLPSHTFSSNRILFYINISGNKIKFIHPEVFKNLRYLHVLYIANNHIVDLHPESFDGLVSLGILWLNNNTIARLSPELFKNLSNLMHFRVDHNRLECIAQEILEKMPHLESFDASHNQIKFLSPAIFSNNNNLQYVDLSHNLIWELSKYTMLHLIKMKTIIFSSNRIESLYLSYLPVSFTSRNKIVRLDMDYDYYRDSIGVEHACNTTREANKLIFHSIDFSQNNIKTIKYSDTKTGSSLMLANISLADNYALNLEVSFFRKERLCTILNLDRTNFNWKNLTLINEMLGLPHLKILSFVGSGVCEFYTKQLLTSIFNPNKRVNVICDGPMTEDLYTNTRMQRNISSSISIEERVNVGVIDSSENYDNTQCLEESSSYNASSFCSFECECYSNSYVTLQKFSSLTTGISCAYILDCSYYSFTDLPEIKSNFPCVLLSHNNVKKIEDEYFQLFYDIHFVDLSYNCLNDLSDDVFNSLISLKTLLLDNNKLTSLKPGVFKHLSALESLTLHGNSITSYNARSFAVSSHLHAISIEFADLDNLHDDTFQNRSNLMVLHMLANTRTSGQKNKVTTEILKNQCELQSLRLVGFNLSESLNGSILCSKYLILFELQSNYLPILTDEIFRGTGNILRIMLPDNGIQSLRHNAFRNLTKVTHIDLSVNSIEVLHISMFSDMQQLESLNVSHNKISCISAAMFQNSSMLHTLDISYNRIVLMDLNLFSMLYNLIFLFLNDNNITVASETHWFNEYKNTCIHLDGLDNSKEINFNDTDIESVLQRKQSIEVINLSNNAFKILDDSMFKHNRFLKLITASHNSIHQIKNDTFKNTRLVVSIELNHNELVVIYASLFKNLTRLQNLVLERNHIEFIEHGSFQDLNALKVLHLSHNRLKTFDPISLPRSLKRLALFDNNIIIYNSSALKHNSLEELYLGYNPLKNFIVDDFFHLPSLVVLELGHTNIHEFSTEAFKNTTKLAYLELAQSCVHSLSGCHFYNMRDLISLDIGNPRTYGCSPGTNNVLSWKNITLINFWFEHPYLQLLNLEGHDICKDLYWNQVIENIFLSETWKIVICSKEENIYSSILSPDANSYLYAHKLKM
ncbi:chaoptin-like [Bacillus rossius redtenbacheri]|uniref:chaoptin-like n=1 Tax=Bacillus rossius redtenbacheri TaxID=93214 RepID=UPI002FDEFC1C